MGVTCGRRVIRGRDRVGGRKKPSRAGGLGRGAVIRTLVTRGAQPKGGALTGVRGRQRGTNLGRVLRCSGQKSKKQKRRGRLWLGSLWSPAHPFAPLSSAELVSRESRVNFCCCVIPRSWGDFSNDFELGRDALESLRKLPAEQLSLKSATPPQSRPSQRGTWSGVRRWGESHPNGRNVCPGEARLLNSML